MKWCVHFPEEEILIKRPCLRKACVGNKIAATFLSFLLYQVSIHQNFTQGRKESPQNTSAEQRYPTTSITLYRTQREMIAQMDHDISDRTLRDTAIPLLIALGYIDVDESEKINRYTVHTAKKYKPVLIGHLR
jgi:hypothetical protein